MVTRTFVTGPLGILYALRLPDGGRLEVQVANPQEQGLLAEGAEVGIRLHRRSLHLLPKEA
ncbi:TOBE domain-containing protein [Candidatus Bipolaricaulota bacterium]|nr:TOBE domain-containing protein [Candidatus Bipolaricaulota bacterium]